MKNKLKIGVLGAGHLGKIHLKLLNQSEKYELVGFYDPNEEQAQKVVAEFGYTYFDNIDQLIEAVEVVDIVTPTLSHYDCAMKAIAAKRHIFIEKPIKQRGFYVLQRRNWRSYPQAYRYFFIQLLLLSNERTFFCTLR